jgi:hypothetical protein
LSAVEIESAIATMRQLNEVLEREFQSCCHGDLILTAIETLDRIGGKISSQNLSLLQAALPSHEKLSAVLFCIRSPSVAHSYGPGERLCQSVASHYQLFHCKLRGFILLTDLTSSVPALLHRMRRMIELCNEVTPSFL